MISPMRFVLLTFLGCLAVRAEPPRLQLQQLADGLERPTFLTNDGSKRIFVVEQPGRVRIMSPDGKIARKPYLDIADRVTDGGECGLLSIAFHPKFAENGYLYVNYTSGRRRGLHTVISEFKADPASDSVDPATERIILTVDQPFSNHNGGQIAFGPDGMLYIGMGDGGSANDPQNNAQNPRSLLGKMLRIDVTPRRGYAIPKDNPMADGRSGRPEIWCGGLRNPWRFCFDPVTGDCITGDVGQNAWEEIDLLVKGGNYGWRPREGFHPTPRFDGREEVRGTYIDPLVEYPRDKGISVTGGYVYRGKKFPSMQGWYFYADFQSGRIWGLRLDRGKLAENVELLGRNDRITPSSFGEDSDGELYICAHARGEIWRVGAKE